MTAAPIDPIAFIKDHLRLPSGRPFGTVMAPWQAEFFEAIFAIEAGPKAVLNALTGRPGSRPRFRLCYSERRRGESKTFDMAAAALADLATGPSWHRSYAVAGDQDQAGLILDSIQEFRAHSPILAELDVQKNVVRNAATGSELRVISSDDRTAYGIRPRKVFFDELSLQQDERLWTAMWTAVGKSPQSQLIAVSMAGFDFASLGWKIRELASSNERYYFQSRAGSELAPWLSPDDMEEQRATLHPSDFSRFWEVKWTEPSGSWITREQYDQSVRGTESARGFGGVGFVDLGLSHDPTVIAVVHRDGDLVVLDTMVTFQGSRDQLVQLADVEQKVLELTKRFGVKRWRFESWQAVASVQSLQRRLTNASVEARHPTADTQGNLFGNLYRLFANGLLTLYPHEQLRKEALSLHVKTIGGRLKVVESSAVHQDHILSVGGAAEMLEDEAAPVMVFTASAPDDDFFTMEPD